MPYYRKTNQLNPPASKNKQPISFRIMFYANKKGSIGKRQLFRNTVQATSEHFALISLYDRYDHITIKSIK